MSEMRKTLADEAVRGQLERRAGRGAVDGELDAVLDALDRVPLVGPSPRFALMRSRRGLAGSLVALAAVVALVVVALPALRSLPGGSIPGYPINQAMTTSQLAALMNAGTLPANATLVVETTIAIRRDVCPMDRYPTVGVIAGVAKQICVMAGNLPLTPSQQSGELTAIFAFRYLGAGYLGYLGQVVSAARVLPFAVTDEWPLQGKTFLVDGWLRSTTQGPVPCASADTAVDPLNPTSSDCPYLDWLAMTSDAAIATPALPTDPLSSTGNARLVQAAGVRILSNLPADAGPVHAVWVVHSEVGPCPGESEISSKGCGFWRVAGKVDEIRLP